MDHICFSNLVDRWSFPAVAPGDCSQRPSILSGRLDLGLLWPCGLWSGPMGTHACSSVEAQTWVMYQLYLWRNIVWKHGISLEMHTVWTTHSNIIRHIFICMYLNIWYIHILHSCDSWTTHQLSGLKPWGAAKISNDRLAGTIARWLSRKWWKGWIPRNTNIGWYLPTGFSL